MALPCPLSLHLLSCIRLFTFRASLPVPARRAFRPPIPPRHPNLSLNRRSCTKTVGHQDAQAGNASNSCRASSPGSGDAHGGAAHQAIGLFLVQP